MVNRRTFIKNGLMFIVGAGGVLKMKPALGKGVASDKSWGIIIDSSRCIGCDSCVVACKLQNKTVEGQFNTTIKTSEKGAYPASTISYKPQICRHCSDSPCVSACRFGAAAKQPSGLVTTDWNLCVSCGVCIPACPYNARFADYRYDDRVDKCDLCIDRISQGLVPACVESCSAGARVFGRFDKPEGRFASYLKKVKKSRSNTGDSVQIL